MSSSCSGRGSRRLETPLEERAYQRITSAAEVSAFLARLARSDRRAVRVTLGQSAGGRALDALLVSADPADLSRGSAPGERLRVMILGSQHGTESSGAEAILVLARDLLQRPELDLLEDVELILVPLANPDGRESRRRVNASGVNLSTDFTVLSQPESRALIDAVVRWQPDVVLDVHESAVYKRQTLARQGYMTDVEAQFEIPNHPNVDAGIRDVSRKRLRPAILAAVRSRGLDAGDYIGEITDIGQPITHGGVTLKNLRNRAAMEGSFSLLVENRLDPSIRSYPTPRNIRVRTEKQRLCLEAFLAVCRAERARLTARIRAARADGQGGGAGSVFLRTAYAPDPERETIAIRLERIEDGTTETLLFPYHGRIVADRAITLPAAYAVTAYQAAIREVLERQHLRYETLRQPEQCRGTVQYVRERRPRAVRGWETETEEREAVLHLPAGTLLVPLDQARPRLVPLLLEPLSNSSVFETPEFGPLVVAGEAFFIVRLQEDCRPR